MASKYHATSSIIATLRHLGFEVQKSHDGTQLQNSEMVADNGDGIRDHMQIDIVIQVHDTKVVRTVELGDLADETPEILAGALSAWKFLVEPQVTV